MEMIKTVSLTAQEASSLILLEDMWKTFLKGCDSYAGCDVCVFKGLCENSESIAREGIVKTFVENLTEHF